MGNPRYIELADEIDALQPARAAVTAGEEAAEETAEIARGLKYEVLQADAGADTSGIDGDIDALDSVAAGSTDPAELEVASRWSSFMRALAHANPAG